VGGGFSGEGMHLELAVADELLGELSAVQGCGGDEGRQDLRTAGPVPLAADQVVEQVESVVHGSRPVDEGVAAFRVIASPSRPSSSYSI